MSRRISPGPFSHERHNYHRSSPPPYHSPGRDYYRSDRGYNNDYRHHEQRNYTRTNEFTSGRSSYYPEEHRSYQNYSHRADRSPDNTRNHPVSNMSEQHYRRDGYADKRDDYPDRYDGYGDRRDGFVDRSDDYVSNRSHERSSHSREPSREFSQGRDFLQNDRMARRDLKEEHGSLSAIAGAYSDSVREPQLSPTREQRIKPILDTSNDGFTFPGFEGNNENKTGVVSQILSQGVENIDDEDAFLYGNDEKKDSKVELNDSSLSSFVRTEKDASHTESWDHNSRETEGRLDRQPGQFGVGSSQYNNTTDLLEQKKINSQSQSEQNEKKDPTIENILKSIGFNFELSKMMQEKAQKEKELEERRKSESIESYGINRGSSFLGDGLSKIEELATQKPASQSSSVAQPSATRSVQKSMSKLQSEESYEERARKYMQQKSAAYAAGYSSPIPDPVIKTTLKNDPFDLGDQFKQSSEGDVDLRSMTLPNLNQPPPNFPPYGNTMDIYSQFGYPPTNVPPPSSNLRVIQTVDDSTLPPKNSTHSNSVAHTSNQGNTFESDSRPVANNRESGGSKRMVMLPEDKSENRQPRDLQTETVKKESEARKRRLLTLEKELEKLKRQQNELMRRRQREKDGHKDPIIARNSKLQEEISNQISILRRLTSADQAQVSSEGQTSAKDSNSSAVPARSHPKPVVKPIVKEEQPITENVLNYEYFDPGNHWCRKCNQVLSNVYDYFSHLHTKKHIMNMDQYDRPWLPDSLKNPKPKTLLPKSQTIAAPLKGSEFLMPVSAIYCALCNVFSGDSTCAEDHLKSSEHNNKYQEFIVDDPYYERRFNLDKAAGLSMMQLKGDDDDSNVPKKASAEKESPSLREASKVDVDLRQQNFRPSTEEFETRRVKRIVKPDQVTKPSFRSDKNKDNKSYKDVRYVHRNDRPWKDKDSRSKSSDSRAPVAGAKKRNTFSRSVYISSDDEDGNSSEFNKRSRYTRSPSPVKCGVNKISLTFSNSTASKNEKKTSANIFDKPDDKPRTTNFSVAARLKEQERNTITNEELIYDDNLQRYITVSTANPKISSEPPPSRFVNAQKTPLQKAMEVRQNYENRMTGKAEVSASSSATITKPQPASNTMYGTSNFTMKKAPTAASKTNSSTAFVSNNKSVKKTNWRKPRIGPVNVNTIPVGKPKVTPQPRPTAAPENIPSPQKPNNSDVKDGSDIEMGSDFEIVDECSD